MLLNIFITLFLVFLNGFFVAAEFAIVKVRASQLELKVRSGSRLAKMARNLTSHLDAYLSATQLGITLASLGLGWIGESVVSEIIKNFITFFGISLTPDLLHQISLPVAFVTITILHIVFGELAPKSIAIQRPEDTSLLIAVPLRVFYITFKPFIWILNTFANWIIKLLGFEPNTAESELHSSEELLYLLEESSKSGVDGIPNQELIENVFDFSETPVKQVMVPRGKIFCIEMKTPPDKIIDKIIDEGFSRLPVYDISIDNIVGVIFAKDFISMMRNSNLIVLKDIIRPAYFVSENEKIDRILRDMQLQKIHLAIVVDEFGGTAGLVTLEDIIEEIVGEIQDEYDEEQPIVTQLNEKEYSVQAFASISDANDYLPVPLPEDDDYETVGGLIVSKEGRIPGENEVIDLNDYLCEIIISSERNIELVKMTLKDDEEEY
ncbi:hemolysin family protein [Bacteroidota bacterium]